MRPLLSNRIGTTYRRHITQVGIDKKCEMFHTPEEVATSRFFTWKTKENFEVEQMRGAPHCNPYETFIAWKFLGIGINYLNDDLQIILDSEFLKPEERRNPIFTDKNQSITQISKILTEYRRRSYDVKRDQNKHRVWC
jgi:hypothetical protein